MESWVKRDNPNIHIEAIRLNEANIEAVAQWCRGDLVDEIDPEDPLESQKGLNVPSPNGVKRASLGMYVFKFGPKNFFVSHNRPFETMYKPDTREAPPLESAGDTRKALGFADPFDRGRNA